MILQSLTSHVRNQSWFAVLLDFVIVGVFIGIQDSSRTDERRGFAGASVAAGLSSSQWDTYLD